VSDLGAPLPLAGVVLLWGSSFLLGKSALMELGPISLALYRWVIGTVGLGACVAWRGQLGEAALLTRQRPCALASLGLVGVALFYTLQNLALHHTTAVHVGILISLNPVLIALLSTLVLRERLNGLQWGGILLAGAGAALVIATETGTELRSGSLLGDGLALLSAGSWAVYSVMGRRLVARHDPLVVTSTVAGWGTVWLLPLAVREGLPLDLSAQTWLVVGLLGLLSSGLAYLLWFRVLVVMPPARAASYLFFIPLVSSALSVVFLHEPFTIQTGLGTALVLGGVACTQREQD
jgi:drug/metabolite transporter (DMT)-like permease